MIYMQGYGINEEALKLYCYYNTERANIYRKKEMEKLDPPYTKDPILREYKFTNVRRELDKQSKYLIKTVCTNSKLSLHEKLFNILLFRLINHDEIIQDTWRGHVFSFPFRTDIPLSDLHTLVYIEKMNNVRRHGDAYLTVVPRKLMNKMVHDHNYSSEFINSNTGLILYLQRHNKLLRLIAEMCEEKEFSSCTASYAYQLLRQINGLGEFLAYQIFVDLTYCPECRFHENEIVVSGIGCCLGVDWLTSEELDASDKRDSFRKKYGNQYNEFLFVFEKDLPKLARKCNIHWDPKEFQKGFPKDNWGLMNIENSFCEFGKYMKIKFGSKFRARKFKSY